MRRHRFLILGPPTVIDGDRVIVLSGRRQQTVLAVLLSNAGQVVPLAYLIDAVWDEAPPETAHRQIQNTVSALRRVLSARSGETAIVTDGRGYVMRPDPGELDAQDFANLVTEAHGLVARGGVAEAAATLRSALALWRGPALLGLGGRAMEAAAARLEEQRLTATELCLDLELRLGLHRELVGELAELVAAHPVRERLVGQLMVALCGSGRQSEAVEAYARLRARLADELGLTPDNATQELYAAILRNDPEVAPGPATRPDVVPAQLPADVPGFTGRADQLRRLDDLLPERIGRPANALVVAGPAGVGKTTLAVHWGHRVRDRFPDGQLYLDLRGFAADPPVRPAAALAHLLRSLGEPAESIPADVQTAAGRWRSLLAGRRVLVVLDNAADADQVRPLLPGGPGCLVLVTSRDRLTGLLARDGAASLALDVLGPDEAHALLATLLTPERVAAEPRAVAELARICSCLPLALRVAAANLTSEPWPDVAGYVAALRDGDRLTALDVEGDAQAGVRRAFDLSYRLLPPGTQRVFRLLGVATGTDLTVEAAAALTAMSAADARRHLDRLVAVSLVNHPVLGRYRCHDLLRRYAAGQAGAEETAAALDRLHDWYLWRADGAARVLYEHAMRLPMPAVDQARPAAFTGEPAALAWLDAERANLVAAIRHAAGHGPRSVAWLLADALRGYFWLGLHLVDWQTAAHAALSAAEAAGDLRARASAQLSLGDSHLRQHRSEAAVERYAAALALAEQTGWAQCEAAATGSLGAIHRDTGRLLQSVEYLDRGLKLCRANGWRHGEAVTLDALARAQLRLGRLTEAGDCCERALRINRAIGSRLGEATALGDWGEVLHAQGRLDEAEDRLTSALPLFEELGDRTNQAFSMHLLAAVKGDRGATAEAAELGRAALELAHDLGEPTIEAEARNTLGTLAHRTGRNREAVGHHERALGLTRATGDHYPEAQAMIGLAAALADLGRGEEALGHARRALTIARELEYSQLEQRARGVLEKI